ncbi:hypothetical protein [Mycoplasma putrefaciens]|uniref:Uncharacterized protein n=1 Tax=Mycoplasma putrefaciens Mput9231 TaxID=1292033 RepID=M9WCT4_9MOLU|nr:hypothetical protein [Mycoplasma putrefaciens]AGJ90942.1 Hypothetical protein MPUT9231_5410 [Mycoplasma putrefaciens Mput9231]
MFKKKKVKFKTISFLDSYWVSNFWIIDNTMFLVKLDKQSTVYAIDAKIVLENLKTNLHTNAFLADPFSDNVINRIKSELEYRFKLDETIIDISLTNNELLITTLKTKTNKNYKYIKNKLEVILNSDHWSIFDKDKYLGSKKALLDKLTIKKIFYSGDNLFIVTDNELYLFKDLQLKKIYSSTSRIQVCKFDLTSVIISDMQLNKTFCFNFVLNKNVNDICNKFYYRLDSWNQKFIVGKPLFDYQKHHNYYLPLEFIYT